MLLVVAEGRKALGVTDISYVIHWVMSNNRLYNHTPASVGITVSGTPNAIFFTDKHGVVMEEGGFSEEMKPMIAGETILFATSRLSIPFFVEDENDKIELPT